MKTNKDGTEEKLRKISKILGEPILATLKVEKKEIGIKAIVTKNAQNSEYFEQDEEDDEGEEPYEPMTIATARDELLHLKPDYLG